MIKIEGNDLRRGGEKIGWIEDRHVHARDGKKLGYFDNKYVYDAMGRKLAYVEGDHLVSYGGGGESKVHLEKVSEAVEGGVMPGIEKCAVYVLLGE